MKKIALVVLTALFATTTFAQFNPSYSGKIQATGMLEKSDMGSYPITEKRVALEAEGVYQSLFYDINYNKLMKKTAMLTAGYGQFKELPNDYLIVWGLGATGIIMPNYDPQKSKALMLGGSGYINLSREYGFDFELNATYASKLKNSSNEWGQTLLWIDGEYIKKFGRLVGLGFNVEYLNQANTETPPIDQSIQYLGQVFTNSRTTAGIFLSLSPKSFQIMLGPELAREKQTQKQSYQPKTFNAGNWLLQFKVKIVYCFMRLKE